MPPPDLRWPANGILIICGNNSDIRPVDSTSPGSDKKKTDMTPEDQPTAGRKNLKSNMIPVARPSLGSEELKLVGEIMESGWLGQGSAVTAFEEGVKAVTGARHVVAVNSGTTALTLALEASGIGSGDTVLVPSLTFCATIQAITATGATPLFCEVNPATLNIDTAVAASRILPSTKAIIPVHFCGQPADMDGIIALAHKHSLTVTEDAAHAFGSSLGEVMVGGHPETTCCFSFDPIKNITCGEGGAITTADTALAARLRRMRMLGIDRDSWHRQKNNLSWYYEVTEQGYRSHMSNLNAAIGVAQLEKMERFRKTRIDAVERYNAAFDPIEGIEIVLRDLSHTFPFAYVLLVTNNRRNDLIKHLASQGVDSGINYIPNHLQPAWNNGLSLPVTEKLYGEIITLPLYSDITEEETEKVIEAVSSFF